MRFVRRFALKSVKTSFKILGITDMLEQIWHEDQKVRDAVVYAYKEYYFKPNNSSIRLENYRYLLYSCYCG